MLEYKSVKTNSGACGYVELGNGPPLIMVVGYTGTLFHWHGKFVHELAKYFRVYLVDNRKIGLSDSNNEESMSGFAKDIADFIDAMKLQKPYLLGWSMGGSAIQEFLKTYQDKVGAAILLASVPHMSYTNREFFEFISNNAGMSAEEYRRKIYYYFFSHHQYQSTKDEIAANALNFSNYKYRFEPAAKSLQDKAIQAWPGMGAADLAGIKIPVLLMWAKNDLVVTEEAVIFHADHLPLAKLIIYSGGGHFLLHENYQQCANDIISFISHQCVKINALANK